MGESRPRVYWDADVLLSWLDDHPERSPIVGLLLGDARAEEIELVTSVLTTVEVAYAATERMTRTLSPEIETRISDLWVPGGPVKVVEVYPLVATRARNLIRDSVPRGWTGLKANDAIHLATAQQMAVVEFHTYDAQLARYGEVVGFPVCEPRTSEPRIM